MTEERDFLSIPEHVPVKIAATMLKISEDRILQHIHSGRLQARRVDGRYQVYIPDIEAFKRNPPGRVRSKSPKWRIYDRRIKLLSTTIQVPIRHDQEQHLQPRLRQLLDEQSHRFSGSMARYVFRDTDTSSLVTIVLLWKDNEMPPDDIRAQEMADFQDELNEFLDWSSATIKHHEGLLYT